MADLQSLDALQVDPLQQVVDPVQPEPPHWAYFAAHVPPEVGDGALVVVVGLAPLLEVVEVGGLLLLLLLLPELPLLVTL